MTTEDTTAAPTTPQLASLRVSQKPGGKVRFAISLKDLEGGAEQLAREIVVDLEGERGAVETHVRSAINGLIEAVTKHIVDEIHIGPQAPAEAPGDANQAEQ